jgi:hypothetical protein
VPVSPARFLARPPYTCRDGIAFRLLRLVWLTARFGRPEPVTFDEYRGRFGVSQRSFHRDVALLGQAGLYIDTGLLGNYRMLCFSGPCGSRARGIAR